MSSLVEFHNLSFLLKNCGNDENISNVALFLNSLVKKLKLKSKKEKANAYWNSR
jgi:hypothetical protein